MEGNFGALQGRIERTLVDEDLCRAVLSSSAVEERPGGGGGGRTWCRSNERGGERKLVVVLGVELTGFMYPNIARLATKKHHKPGWLSGIASH